MLRTKSNRLIWPSSSSFCYQRCFEGPTVLMFLAAPALCRSPVQAWLVADGVCDALLGEADLGRARELAVGGGGIAGRCGIGLALFHETGECRAGELLVGRLRLAGRL